MQRTAEMLKGSYLPRLGNMLADFSMVTASNIDAAGAAINTVRKAEFREAWKGMSPLERGLLIFAAAAAAAEASDSIGKGMSPLEAIPRAGTNLTVEIAIGAVPITAAAHAASLVIFDAVARITGDDGYRDVNVENAAKAMAQAAIDEWGNLVQGLVEGAIRSDTDILINDAADRATIEHWLGVAESRLNEAEPGSARSRDLMQSRAALRALLRAKIRAEAIARLTPELSEAQRKRTHLARGGASAVYEAQRKLVERLEAQMASLRARDC